MAKSASKRTHKPIHKVKKKWALIKQANDQLLSKLESQS